MMFLSLLAATAAMSVPAPKPVASAELASSLFMPGEAVDVEYEGKSFRVFTMVPDVPAAPEGYPMLVVLDGNQTFYTAAASAYGRSRYFESAPVVIVGVGYPTSDMNVILTRRMDDLMPTVEKDPRILAIRPPGSPGGQAAQFRKFLTDRLPSLIESKAKVNRRCTSIFGHSAGGLFVVDTFMREPSTYQGYFASSPSLHNDNYAVLQLEQNFVRKLRELKAPITVELAVGGLERSFSERQLNNIPNLRSLPDPRMVAAVEDLGKWLESLHSSNLNVSYGVVEGEGHMSVVPGNLSKAIALAARCE